MNELKILEHIEFGRVRTMVDTKGKVLFCASDVAKVLKYSNVKDAISRHCPCVVKHDTWVKTGTKKGGESAKRMTKMLFITEGDVYRLITHSKLPSAIKFERWVFDEVLPALRKGELISEKDILNNPDLLIKMAVKIKELQAENNLLLEENSELEETITEYEPKIDYLETILNSECPMTITQIAADYGISAMQLNNILHEARIQRKVNEQWVLYREYMNLGLTNSETIKLRNENKSIVVTKWTQAGRLLIHEVMTALRTEAYQMSFDFGA